MLNDLLYRLRSILRRRGRRSRRRTALPYGTTGCETRGHRSAGCGGRARSPIAAGRIRTGERKLPGRPRTAVVGRGRAKPQVRQPDAAAFAGIRGRRHPYDDARHRREYRAFHDHRRGAAPSDTDYASRKLLCSPGGSDMDDGGFADHAATRPHCPGTRRQPDYRSHIWRNRGDAARQPGVGQLFRDSWDTCPGGPGIQCEGRRPGRFRGTQRLFLEPPFPPRFCR